MGHDSIAFRQRRNAPPHIKKPLRKFSNGNFIIKAFPKIRIRKATYRNVEGQTSGKPLMPAEFST